MTVQCPRCGTRFRLPPERVGSSGVRLRCSRCRAVFRVASPAAARERSPGTRPPAGEVPCALVAEGDPEVAKQIAGLLARWGLRAEVRHDGVEALLHLFRAPPALAVLGGRLPGVSAQVLAEVVRRTRELAGVRLIRVVTFEEPVGAPEFDADHRVEPGDLPGALEPLLARLGLGRPPAPPPPVLAAPSGAEASSAAEGERPGASAPGRPPGAAGAPQGEAGASDRGGSGPSRRGRSPRPVSSDPEIAAAERLARIIVSDIILYNEGKFAGGVRSGDVAGAVRDELAEGALLFEQRIPAQIRSRRDFLGEELRFREDQLRQAP